MANDEVNNLTITHKNRSSKTEFYGLIKRSKQQKKNGFRFFKMMKLTKKLIQIYEI